MVADSITLTDVTKRFGSFVAIDHLSLSVRQGEFFSMLGPSGSGKTTTLRLIAGFEKPTSGVIALDGEDVTAKAPFDRDVNTVFQDYALFPHMNVLDNVAYGLKVRGVAKKERYDRAHAMLELVQLDSKADYRIRQLSGGQQQRVALARALVLKPKVLLLDEPLSALDMKLRQQMQVELKHLQRELGITFVFVTHDQQEAMVMSDRIAVFNKGRIQQMGTPSEIYDHPANDFVAGFVGTTNLVPQQLSYDAGLGDGRYAIRPERITFSVSSEQSADGILTKGTVSDCTYLGTEYRIIVTLPGNVAFTVVRPAGESVPDPGDTLALAWNKSDMIALDGDK
ncbi:ABC transporter ATP-binding protein [Bifidobacterium thermacidophilum]|uniref:ABC transporter ATP-binding protein n=1 Tax=Bifidobacterium thermacidophilum TaxID=246618 RepID=UPI0026229383|nr:ABC transporter ATP-binding protein [uncultured Bifidobacterium sp.]